MCGRFSLSDTRRLASRYARFIFPEHEGAHYNIAPTQDVLAVTTSSIPRAVHLRWGLVPAWSRGPGDARAGARLINARVESIGERPAFRDAVETNRRCVIFADGFYEWSGPSHGRGRLPYHIHAHDRAPFAFAGLWDVWYPQEGGEPLRTCTIITVPARASLARVHDRMPAIVDDEAVDIWLTPGDIPSPRIGRLLNAFDVDALELTRVSTRVNSVKNDDPSLLEPQAPDTSPALFEDGF